MGERKPYLLNINTWAKREGLSDTIVWQKPVTCADGHIAQHTYSTATGPQPYHIAQEDDGIYVLYFEDRDYNIEALSRHRYLPDARQAAEIHWYIKAKWALYFDSNMSKETTNDE